MKSDSRTFIVTVAAIPEKEIEIEIDKDRFEDEEVVDIIEEMLEDEYIDNIDIKLLTWKEITSQTPRQV